MRRVPTRAGLAWATSLAAMCLGGCGEAQPQPKSEPSAEAPASATSSGVGEPKVSLEIRVHVGKDATCESSDVCGFFLQIISPGSDAKPLADKAVKLITGKCAGHVIVYKDKRGVMGAGSVFASAEEKRACEKALERPSEDTDFPSYAVWRVNPKP